MKQSPQEVACTLGTHKARWDKAPEQMYNPTRGNGDSNRSFLSHTFKKYSLAARSPHKVMEGKVLLDQ